MISSLRIGIAEDEPDMREFYEVVIPEMGHCLLWAARNGIELVKLAQQMLPDVLIVDIQMPFLDGLDAVRSVTRYDPVMVIIVSGHHDRETMKRAEAEQLMAYLIKPIREADLRAAITIASKRFDDLQLLRQIQAQRSGRAAKVRQSILSAIGSVTKTRQVSPQQALSRLQELAKKEQRTLAEVSQTIVDSVGQIDAN